MDYSIGTIIEHFYFKQKSGYYFHLNYIIEKSRDDILIFGNSRADSSYVPNILSGKIHMSCWNTGCHYQTLYWTYAIQDVIFNRKKPKISIYDLDPNTLFYDIKDLGYLSHLLPYYHRHNSIKEVLKLRSKFEPIKMLSKCYPYNSKLLSVIKHISGSGTLSKSNGYSSLTRTMPFETMDQNFANAAPEPISETKKQYLERIIEQTRQEGIQAIFIISPIYKKTNRENSGIKALHEILEQNKVVIWDYTEDSTYNQNRKIWSDRRHLNDTGAQLFTTEIAGRLATFYAQRKGYATLKR